MNCIFFGEAFNQIVFMLPHALHQVAGHTDVERAVAFTGKDVNGWLHGLWLLEFQKRDVLSLNI